MRKQKQKSEESFIIKHIKTNAREYGILLIIFLIGVLIGIFVVNHLSESQKNENTSYVLSLINKIKENKQINYTELLKESLIKNLIIAGSFWIVGITVTLVPIIYGIICFRGFCLGYTISSIIAILGEGRGLAVSISSLLLQNLTLIPIILVLAQSGIQVHKRTINKNQEPKNRHSRDSIKSEILRHSILSIIMTILLGISSLIETYISSNLFELIVKFIQ